MPERTFMDDYFVENDGLEFLRNKEKPYSPNNTLCPYVWCKTRRHKENEGYDVHFIQIARTFPNWDREVKVIYDGKLSDRFYYINSNNNEITVPICKEDMETDNKSKFRDIEVTGDTIIFSLEELKEIQKLGNKKAILASPVITKLHKLFLRWYWKSHKNVLPKDTIYQSLMYISQTKGKFLGFPITWDSSIMGETMGISKQQAYMTVLLMQDLGSCAGYKDADFDYFPTAIRLVSSNAQSQMLVGRKELASLYRRKVLSFIG